MKNEKNAAVMALQGLLITFCMLCCIYTIVMGTGSDGQQLPAITCLAALAATVYYVYWGYSKSGANAFKTMLLFCALAALMCIVPALYNKEMISRLPTATTLCVLGYAVCFGLYLILALVPDLGKKKTFAIILFLFLFHEAVFFTTLILQPGAVVSDGTRFDSMRGMRLSCMVVLDINTAICSYFKYRDKAARGSR